LLQVTSSRLPAPTPELFVAAGLAAADNMAQAGAPRAAAEEIRKRAADQAAALRGAFEVSSSAKAARPKRRNGLAAFRAVEAEVHAALSTGRTVLAIYEEKRDRLAMSYAQFARGTRSRSAWPSGAIADDLRSRSALHRGARNEYTSVPEPAVTVRRARPQRR